MLHLYLVEDWDKTAALCRRAGIEPPLMRFAVAADRENLEEYALFAKEGDAIVLKAAAAGEEGLLDGLVRAGLNSALLRGIAYGRLEETLPCRQRLEALGLKVGETFPLEAFFSCHHCGQHPKTE